MIYQIKNRYTGTVIVEGEAESMRELIIAELNRGSNLRGSDLSWSDLRGSNLRGSNLSGSNLRGSDLSWSDLRGSDLRGSDLRGSNLRGSDLSWSDLRGSDLRGSDLSGSNLSDAKGISGYFCFGPIGSRGAYTWARWEDGKYIVHCGCKNVPLDEFERLVKETHPDNIHGREYMAMIAMMRIRAEATKPAEEGK